MFKAADAARTKTKSTLTVAHNFDKDITNFFTMAPQLHVCTSVCSSSTDEHPLQSTKNYC